MALSRLLADATDQNVAGVIAQVAADRAVPAVPIRTVPRAGGDELDRHLARRGTGFNGSHTGRPVGQGQRQGYGGDLGGAGPLMSPG